VQNKKFKTVRVDPAQVQLPKSAPLFFRPAWLQQYQQPLHYLLTYGPQGEVIAYWPWVQQRRRGLRIYRNPPLTPYLGPWIDYATGLRNYERYSLEKKILHSLLTALPVAPLLQAGCHPQFRNWLPLYWAGWQQMTHYTFRLPLTQKEVLWKNMKPTVRNNIRRGKKLLGLECEADPMVFYTLLRATLKARGLRMPLDAATFLRLYAYIRATDAGQVLLVKDGNGEALAAAFLVWDQEVAYTVGLAAQPEQRERAAMAYLLWNCMTLMQGQVNHFDFEGSMVSGVERVFADFDANQVPCMLLHKTPNRFWEALRVLVAGRM